jgi:hypothetical protein
MYPTQAKLEWATLQRCSICVHLIWLYSGA